MSSGIDVRWMSDRTTQVVLAAVDRDAATAARVVCDVGERYGWRGGYAMCCALAAAVVQMGGHQPDPGTFAGFVVIRDGVRVEPEDATGAEDVVLATRFVVAQANGDEQTKLALFMAARTPRDALRLPVGLIKLVGAYGRHRLAHHQGGERS